MFTRAISANQLLTVANASLEPKTAETLDKFAQLLTLSAVFKNLSNDQQSCLSPLPES